jgi:release factor glutamine methyltransferase
MSGPSVGAVLGAARERIGALEARALLCHVLARDPAHLIAHSEEILAPDALACFERLVARRAAGEPVAYLTGDREFYGRSFSVSPDVLIPRPETELLVELVLSHLPSRAARVLDLGTGSGCIAISVALESPQCAVRATDASSAALALARENARALGASHVRFVEGCWYEALGAEAFDVIASNPPYVAARDPHLREGDLRYEPPASLEGGGDGLVCIRAIVAGAAAHLAPGGWLFLEHGHDQAERCRELLRSAGFGRVASWRDLSDIERVTGGRLTVAVANG